MLNRLFIKNFVIISQLDLEFSGGLSVITGETGSGKSLILDSISFCLSGKEGKEIVRHGEENCNVILSFDYDEEISIILKENGFEIDKEDGINISRHINQEGKKRLTINNQPCSQKIIDLFADKIVTIYGQHSFSALFKSSSHIRFLDNFSTDKALLKNVSDNYRKIREIEKNIVLAQEMLKKSKLEEDYLLHAASELGEARIIEGEEEELAEKRTEIQKRTKQKQFIQDIYDNFNSSQLVSNTSSLLRQISRSNHEGLFDDLTIHLEKALDSLSEVETEIESRVNESISEEYIDNIEERLFMIRGLARKYNVPASELNNLLSDMKRKLSIISNSDQELKLLDKSLLEAKKEYFLLAEGLSEIRKTNAEIIEEEVSKELDLLHMKGCKFEIKIERVSPENITESGLDLVNFTASTNPGVPSSNLEKIASGGEMARFMLALQLVLFKKNKHNPMIIFDEIDTGIGGIVADSVGVRLKELGSITQVLAVTHQPQVAAKSMNHILVSKESVKENTTSCAKLLSEQQKINEIARMLSGKITTEAAKEAARDLIR